MRIRLNENEVYEIKLPEEIGSDELPMITARFNTLMKSFSRFTPLSSDKLSNENGKSILLGQKTEKLYKKQNREQYQTLRDNRKIFIELLNTYYNGTMEDFEKLKSKYNFTFDRTNMSSGNMVRVKELHKVKPIEVGLTKFPNKIEQVENLRIKK